MGAYLIWNVRVICAGNINKRPETVHHLAHWRRRGSRFGVRRRRRRGVNWGAFIHSFTHSRVHPFTRLVIAPCAAPPVPAYTCAMRPGHAFCYMLPV